MSQTPQNYIIEMQDGEKIEIDNMILSQKFGFLEFRPPDINFEYQQPTFGVRAELVRAWTVDVKKIEPPRVTRTGVRRRVRT